jgi:hypothetical protein
MFDYSSKPSRESAAVRLLQDDRNGDLANLEALLSRAADRHGFDFATTSWEAVSRDSFQATVGLLICVSSQPYDAHLVSSCGSLLDRFDTVSIAFSYPDVDAMLGSRPLVEQAKLRYRHRLNFLRPDENRCGRRVVSLQKLVDNAVCDTVRVKYIPRRIEQPVRLRPSEIEYFRLASEVYERYRLFHREPTDGYMALRMGRDFAITATKTSKTGLDLSRISIVQDYDEDSNTLTYSGSYLPSSDSVEAAIVFRELEHVEALIHTHACDLFTYNPRCVDRVVVPKLPYGEPALGHSLAKALRDCPDGFVIMSEHGEVFAGPAVPPDHLPTFVASQCALARSEKSP